MSEKGGKPSICIVDDFGPHRDICRIYFESKGHCVIDTDKPHKAPLFCDIVLVDLIMPGFICCDPVRAVRETVGDKPVILGFSAQGDELRERAIEMGADECLSKMWDIDLIYIIVVKCYDNLKMTKGVGENAMGVLSKLAANLSALVNSPI